MTEKISVIIPCFNEVRTIEKIIEKIHLVQGINKEIILVDDFSNDGSRELIQTKLKNKIDTLILNEKNYGKGYSIIQAKKKITGDIVIIQDADLEYDPNDLLKFEEVFLKFNADGIIGSRFNYDKFTRSHSILNKIGNYILTLTFNILYNTTFTDIYSCYFAFKKELINANNLNVKGFAQHAEILTKIIIKGNKFYEVPINYNGRNTAEGKKIRFYHFFPVLFQILLGRFR